MLNAIKLGLATEEAVTRSLTRGLRQQFQAGRFDSGVWADLGADDINSTYHQQVQREAALQVRKAIQASCWVVRSHFVFRFRARFRIAVLTRVRAGFRVAQK
eukprot:COSAG01_NODE_1187_length_11337_cov_185.267574_10_plen_102_part_00